MESHGGPSYYAAQFYLDALVTYVVHKLSFSLHWQSFLQQKLFNSKWFQRWRITFFFFLIIFFSGFTALLVQPLHPLELPTTLFYLVL
jgi:hypothetical protein